MAFTFVRPDRSPTARLFAFTPAPAREVARPRPARATTDRTVVGILAILGSTIAFPLSDLAAQSLMGALPSIEVAWLRYMVFGLIVLPLLARGGGRVLRTAKPGLQLLRGAMSACSTLAALVSFKFLGVPEATAIGFVAPVIVTALAVLFLGETVGLRRWAAALAALVGVVVIVQPGGDSFQPAAVLPLAGAFASAVAVICTRRNTTDSAATTVLYSAIIGTIILSGLVCFDWVTPTLAQLQTAVVVGLFGALGTLLQVIAYRIAPASLLAPVTSMQLVFAGGLSYVLLGTIPTTGMLTGGAIIGASALYTGYRERVRGAV